MEKNFNVDFASEVEIVAPLQPVSELSDAHLALIGGGIGDTVL